MAALETCIREAIPGFSQTVPGNVRMVPRFDHSFLLANNFQSLTYSVGPTRKRSSDAD
jgi:hypothetical protein